MNQVSRSLDPASGKKVYSTKSEIIVRYRPFFELENWFKYRLEEKNKNKAFFFWATAIIFFMLGGPNFVLFVLERFLMFLNNGAAVANMMAAKQAASSIVGYFYLTLGSIAATAAAIYYSQPTHLSLSDRGVRFLYRQTIFGEKLYSRDGKAIPWQLVRGINIVRHPKKPSPGDNMLTFSGGDGPRFKARLGSIPSTEERGRLLAAIENWAPEVPRDAEVMLALEPPSDHSYTELWMKALSAPPKREKLKPLVENAVLRDGAYRVGGALGVGGQGTAYLAYDLTADGSSVVLKEFILPVYVDIQVRRQALERFEKEAKILKQLNHDQIVKLIDFFIEDHRGYLVLEHIDGQSLRQVVEASGKIEEEKVVQLAKQMCTILEYLHSLSPPVVHRDFTPDNLILRKDGTLKLVDFNVAQQTDVTATGTVVGKHAYLPPEQFRGLPNTRSDIYAMGATMFYLLTGEDPEPISISHPRETNPAVSKEIDRIVAQATHLDPVLRYQGAEQVADELGSFAKT